jgi:Glycosyl transferase family 11
MMAIMTLNYLSKILVEEELLMSNDKSEDTIARSKYTAKSETERLFSVFETLHKDAEETKNSSVEDTTSDRQPVLTMSSIGQLGRFGNQLFQYAFLRLCAEKSGARVECPPWVGQTLFGHQDPTISKRLPPAIERRDEEETLFDVIPEFIPYIEKLADTKSSRVGIEALNTGLVNVDLWGFFQFHTRYFKPHQQYFRSLFQPVNDLKLALEDGLNTLRSKGTTIVGIHIRRSDYLKEPRMGFTLVFPTKWYCEWLEGIWHELEDPILLLCSDDLDGILTDFEKFSPVTTGDLNIQLPAEMKELDFYTDFFMLSQCDVVCSSNSNFSFVACMLNQRAKMFVRPHWDFSSRFIVFDPWDSHPLLYIGQPKFLKTLTEIVRTTHATQGTWAMLKSVFIYVPQGIIKKWLLRAYLRYKINGIFGAIDCF